MYLLFDFGGVLVDLDRQRVERSFDEIGFDIRPYLGTYKQAGIAAWESYLTTVPTERLEMLLKIKQNYSINVLSNTNTIHWRMAEDTFFRYKGLTVDDFFDHIFLSCELGVEKPAPQIFENVVEGMGVPAHDILFFDDSEVNCQSARQCAPAGSEWFKYFDEYGKLHLPYIQA